MAFKKTLVQRLFNLSRFSTPRTNPTNAGKPDPTRMRRVGQRRPMMSSPAGLRLFPPAGGSLAEKLRGMDITRDRIRLDGLIPFPAATEEHAPPEGGLTVSDVKKVIRASQVEMIREKLREIPKDWISYSEFVEICKQNCGGNYEQGLDFAKTLDESGSVIVLGNAVFLRHHQVTKAIQSIVSHSLVDPNDPRKAELETMEEQKAEIDRKADALVRRELWAGLGYMVAQTAAFMRLTFWELSWDVMEPICFYVTSFYFMLGYTFFLRTSKEPSFEGFFQSRFNAKQKRLMKARNFDLERYNELRKGFDPLHLSSSSKSWFDDAKMMKFVDDHQKSG